MGPRLMAGESDWLKIGHRHDDDALTPGAVAAQGLVLKAEIAHTLITRVEATAEAVKVADPDHALVRTLGAKAEAEAKVEV